IRDKLVTGVQTCALPIFWNPKDQFYEVVSPAPDSGIRKQKKFVDPGTNLQFSGVRELIGYIPWQFDIPAASHAVAWKQLFDPEEIGRASCRERVEIAGVG